MDLNMCITYVTTKISIQRVIFVKKDFNKSPKLEYQKDSS